MKYHVYGKVVATKYLGAFEADNAEAAEELAMAENGGVSVCHQCAREVGDPEIESCIAELDDTHAPEAAPRA